MACVGSPRKEVTEEGFDSGQAALKPELPSQVRTVLVSRRGVGRLLCVGGGGGTVMWAQTDVNRPDGGWIQKEDISPLLGLPHLDRPQEVGASKCPSVSRPPFCLLARDPINLQVLQAFVDCHEFANLNLVQALR